MTIVVILYIRTANYVATACIYIHFITIIDRYICICGFGVINFQFTLFVLEVCCHLVIIETGFSIYLVNFHF